MTEDDFDVIRPSEERAPAYCDNPACGEPLGTDHAVLIAGVVVRRYCNARCVAYGCISEGAIDFGDDRDEQRS
jgi:hypothetical protein